MAVVFFMLDDLDPVTAGLTAQVVRAGLGDLDPWRGQQAVLRDLSAPAS
jgi:hypothetical protein